MNKWISKIAAAVALAAASGSVMAADGNFFVNGEVAGSNANISNLQDTTSTAGAVRFGYLWNAGPMSWGIETGYVDLGKVSGNYYDYSFGNPNSLHASVTTRGSMLGGNFKTHFGYNSGWFVSGRLGWFHSNVHANVNDAYGDSTSDSVTGDGTYAGVGVGYDFNPHMGIAMNFDNYQSNANGIYNRRFNTGMYGGTFEYRF
jgi:outer membrane protein with beta-barrel domain